MEICFYRMREDKGERDYSLSLFNKEIETWWPIMGLHATCPLKLKNVFSK